MVVPLGLEKPVDVCELVLGKRILQDPGLDGFRGGGQLFDLRSARVDEHRCRTQQSCSDLCKQVLRH